MATLNKKGGDAARYAGMPSGNTFIGKYPFVVSTAGKWVDDAAASPAVVTIGDVIRLGVIPAGTSMDECKLNVQTAFSASSTCKVGFQYVDGVDLSAPYAQDDAYFIAASQAMSSAATVRMNTAKAPMVLQKDAYVIVTWAGANQAAAAARADFTVLGEVVGAK